MRDRILGNRVTRFEYAFAYHYYSEWLRGFENR